MRENIQLSGFNLFFAKISFSALFNFLGCFMVAPFRERTKTAPIACLLHTIRLVTRYCRYSYYLCFEKLLPFLFFFVALHPHGICGWMCFLLTFSLILNLFISLILVLSKMVPCLLLWPFQVLRYVPDTWCLIQRPAYPHGKPFCLNYDHLNAIGIHCIGSWSCLLLQAV